LPDHICDIIRKYNSYFFLDFSGLGSSGKTPAAFRNGSAMAVTALISYAPSFIS